MSRIAAVGFIFGLIVRLALGQQLVWLQPVLTGQTVTYSPDGQLIATPTQGNRIALYQNGQVVGILSGATDAIMAIAFSPDGQYLAATGYDGSLRQWRIADQALLWSQSVFSGEAGYCVTYIDNQKIAVGGSGGILQVRSVADGGIVQSLVWHSSSSTVMALAVSPDRTQLISADSGGSVALWRISDGVRLQSWQAHLASLSAVAWSPDGALLATGTLLGDMRIWERNGGSQWVLKDTLNAAHDFGVTGLAFASSTLLYSAGYDGKVRRWNPSTGAFLSEFTAHADGINGFALRPDNAQLATAGADRSVRLWNPGTGTLQSSLAGHTDIVTGVGFVSNGYVISVDASGVLRFWQATSGAPQGNPINHNSPILELAIAPSRDQVAIGDFDGKITLRLMPTGAVVRSWDAHGSEVTSVAYSSDGARLVSGGYDGSIKIWNLATGALVRTLGTGTEPILCVAYRGSRVAAGDTSGTVRLWDADTGNLLRTLNAHTDLAQAVAFSPNGLYVATGGADGYVRLWNVSDGAVVRELPNHTFGVTQLRFLAADALAVADGEGVLRVYEVPTGNLIGQIQPLQGWVQSMDVSDDGQWVVLGGDEGLAMVRRTSLFNRPPNVPELIAPADNATLSRTPTFRVRAVDPDNNQVRVDVELDSNGQSTLLQSNFVPSGTTIDISVPPSAPLRPGSYTWRARAYDDQGAVSDWSSTRAFTVPNNAPSVPTLLEPDDGATTNRTPTFRLQLSDADGDRCRAVVRISGDGGFERTLTSELVSSGSEASLAVSAQNPLPPGNYTWQARTEDEFGATSDWSSARAFTVPSPNTPPNIPELLQPAPNATVPRTPTFTARLTDPDSNRVKAEIQILLEDGSSRTMETALVDSGQEASVAVPSDQPLPVGTHQWRARALDAHNATSDWSESRTFTVSEDNNNGGGSPNNPPTIPELLQPAANAATSATPTFRLRATDPENEALVYEIEVSIGNRQFQFLSAAAPSGQEATVRVPVSQALPAGQGSWRARARDAANQWSDWSASRPLVISNTLPTQIQGVVALGLNLQTADASLSALGLQGVRVVAWNADSNQYSDVDMLQVGRGYFLKADTPVQPNFSGAPITGELRIPLQTGWNLMSNPYLTELAWSDVAIRVEFAGEVRGLNEAAQAGWIANYGWMWDATQRRYQLLYDPAILPIARGTLPAGQAAWVLALRPCTLILNPATRGRAEPRAFMNASMWALRLQAVIEGHSSEVVLGMGRSVQAIAPPDAPAGETPVQLSLQHAQQRLSADLRAETPMRWQLILQVASGETPRIVELRLPDIALLPHGVDLRLRDEQTGRAIPLRGRATYRFTAPSEGGVFHFTIEPARRSQLLRILSPGVSGGRSTNSAFVIQATLTAAAQVQAQVLLNGRTVRSLPLQAVRSAGQVQLTWDGRDDAGRALPPGAYTVQIMAQSEDGQIARSVVPILLTR
ncbi:MAG: hypothetical protein KatS3mg016_2351 [Fimbriimonadales bacterium]|nr:MAG: hypothetical protein KatS3mg016_2351 [Fimbriimonadales bacterium]